MEKSTVGQNKKNTKTPKQKNQLRNGEAGFSVLLFSKKTKNRLVFFMILRYNKSIQF